LVRYAELHAQTTTPSRTATVSGASPVFTLPNPLSGELLKLPSSVHFQDFHPLQGLGRSCAHNALTGNFTLLLQATRRTSGCDPVHPSLLCMPLRRFRLCFVHARVLRRQTARLASPSLTTCVLSVVHLSGSTETGSTPAAGSTAFRISGARSSRQRRRSQACAPPLARHPIPNRTSSRRPDAGRAYGVDGGDYSACAGLLPRPSGHGAGMCLACTPRGWHQVANLVHAHRMLTTQCSTVGAVDSTANEYFECRR